MFIKTRLSILFAMALGVFILAYLTLHALQAAFSTGVMGFLFFLPLAALLGTFTLKLTKSMKRVFTFQ